MASPTVRSGIGAELWRRSRIKTVVSRRFTSSFSSTQSHNNDEEAIFSEEDDEYMSCFEEIPDSGESNKTEDESFESLKEHDGSGESHPRASSSSRNSFKSNKRTNDNHNNFLQNGSNEVNSLLKTIFNYRDDDQTIGENAEQQQQGQNEDNDFVDMAINRDERDLGFHRADPKYVNREKLKPTQTEKIPKLKKFNPEVKFGWFDTLIGTVAIVVFFIDIGTDIELAAHYLREEMWMYGGVTLGLIIAPSLITCFLGFHWYVIDYKRERAFIARLRKSKRKAHVTPTYVWFFRFTFTLLQVGPVVRIIEYLRCGYMSRSMNLSAARRKQYYKLMLYEDVDSCLLRLFESFLESAPQLTWQLYIAIVLKPSYDVVGTSIRCVALLSSWGSLAISLVSYHKSLRISHEEKAKMTKKSMPIYFLWRASEVGGRVICISMFASAFQLWVFGFLLFHWIFMSCWLMIQKTTFYNNKCLERAFNVICGYVMIFCFLNLREGVTRFRFLFFYIITYCESFFMLGLWFRFSPDLGAWFHIWGFIVVLVLFLSHIIFQLLYYSLFHPSDKIPMCLPCDPRIIYSSTCYDIELSDKNDSQTNNVCNQASNVEIMVDVNGIDRGGTNHSENITKFTTV